MVKIRNDFKDYEKLPILITAKLYGITALASVKIIIELHPHLQCLLKMHTWINGVDLFFLDGPVGQKSSS